MKNKFKILFTALIISIILVMSCSTVFADVISIPEDDFFEENEENCEYIDRCYIANGENGYVNVYKEIGERPLTYVLNGKKLNVVYTYKDASGLMGNVMYYNEASGKTNAVDEYFSDYDCFWVYMSDLVLYYDSTEFMNEHKDEITNTDTPITLEADTNICNYEYPCSEWRSSVWAIWDDADFYTFYTDESGRLWGYISYYYGNKDLWVCLDDSANTDIPYKVETDDGIIPAAEPTDTSQFGQSGLSPIGIAAIAVGAVAIITLIVILIVFGKKKKKNNKTSEVEN